MKKILLFLLVSSNLFSFWGKKDEIKVCTNRYVEYAKKGTNRYLVVRTNYYQTNRKFILTIDDGPNQYTVPIAKILLSNNIQAVFFFTEQGSNRMIQRYKDTIRFVISNGFFVGNHSRSHERQILNYTSIGHARDDIKYVNDLMKKLYDYDCTLYRVPFGGLGNLQLQALNDLDMRVIGWTIAFGEEQNLKWAVKNELELACEMRSTDIIVIHDSLYWRNNLSSFITLMKKYGTFMDRKELTIYKMRDL